jgi:hypothetical protein
MVKAPFVRRLFVGRKAVVITAIGLTLVLASGLVAFAATDAPATSAQSASGTTTSTTIGGSPSKGANSGSQIPVPGGAALGAAGYNDVSCISSTNCVSVGAGATGQAAIGLTSNGGTTYQAATTVPSGTPDLRADSCVSGTLCAAVGGNDIITSIDGGQSWTAHVLNAPELNLLGVVCPSTSLCLASGENEQVSSPQAEIYRSTDQGTTWTLASTPPQVVGIAAMACPTASTCIAVGSAVLVSSDGGATWAPVGVTGGIQNLNSISCASATTCVAVGPNPEGPFTHSLPADAIVTTNGGSSFSNLTLPPYTASVFEISCSTNLTCLASGAEGTGQSGAAFAVSSDGGATWSTPTPPPDFVGVAGISCVSDGTCVLVGSTTSGGATVTRSPSASWGPVSSTNP